MVVGTRILVIEAIILSSEEAAVEIDPRPVGRVALRQDITGFDVAERAFGGGEIAVALR